MPKKPEKAAPLTVRYEETRQGWYVRIWLFKEQAEPAVLGPFGNSEDAADACADYQASAAARD